MSETKKKTTEKFTCHTCEKQHSIGNRQIVDTINYCLDCFRGALGNNEIMNCGYCDTLHSQHTVRLFNRGHHYVCNECFDNDFYECEDCNHIELNGNTCLCQQGDRPQREDEIQHRHFNKNCRTHISQKGEFGEIIQSSRKYGVELEVFNTERKPLIELAKMISKDFGLDHDGSILDNGGGRHPNAIEVVTPPMCGKKGEDGLKELLKQLNDKNFETNDSCGLHVHFDAPEFKSKTEVFINRVKDVDEKNFKPNLDRFIIKKDLMDYLGGFANLQKTIEIVYEVLNNRSGQQLGLAKKMGTKFNEKYKNIMVSENYGKVEIDGKSVGNISKIYAMSNDETEECNKKFDKLMDSDKYNGTQSRYPKPKTEDEDYFCQVDKKDNLRNLKTLFYLYTAFQDVFLSMLPNNRRENNRHCQKLTSKFSLRDIEYLRSQEELETLWFKTGDTQEKQHKKSNKYDDSRYYGFNLHTLFGKYGTIEIRHHDGTTDIDNILYWVALHQTIIDKVASGRIDIGRLVDGADLFSIEDRKDYLLDILDLRKGLKDYVNTKIDHFKKK